MTHVPTVHNPTHFYPAQYEVLDYLDGKRPVYYGQGVETYAEEVKFWEGEMVCAFGADWKAKNVRRCVHCGHNPLRWLTVVKHLPTGDTVVFGADCTKRLEFVDQKTYKLAQLQARDAANKVRIKVWNAREAFLKANPAFAAAIEQAKGEVHAKNYFVHDVIGKLGQYGSLSVNQVNAVITSLARDVEYAAKKAVEVTEVKGDAPVGRVTVTGTVLSLKDQPSSFVPGGYVRKMLVKLANNSRVWMTAPSKHTIDRGDVVTVTATFEASKDKDFSFGSRPSLVKVEHPTVA
jgi:hypothetical protein